MNFPWWLFLLYVAKGADFASTEYMLAYRPDTYEANILMTNRSVRYATFFAAPAVAEWGARRLERRGNEKLALWARVALIIGWSFAAGWNMSQ